MNKSLVAAAAVLLLLGTPASAHRLDEYLQATLISVESDRVQAVMRLLPGVAASAVVLAGIDTDADSVISQTEQRTYAERVLGDLSLKVDDKGLRPRLVSVDFPDAGEMKEGLGEIRIAFAADLPVGGPDRRLVFENHHQERIAVYLVNCLVPGDQDIRVIAQNRNEQQSFYQLDYVQSGARPKAAYFNPSSEVRGWMSTVRGWFGGFASMFRLGMRHIAEGSDHLLFLLALLLPAPLLVFRSRWTGFGGVRHCLLQILRVVTAFTVGHSITLMLAASGLVRAPGRPVEVMIAVSILVSAAHALRPLFPGREAGVAGFFGIIHGLAFATILGDLGLSGWELVTGMVGFNLGIETMQLIVVAAAMPSLVLLSRTRLYTVLRIGGAFVAGFAAIGWLADRLLDAPNSIGVVVESVAHHAVWIAAVLFVISLICWRFRDSKHGRKSVHI